MKNLYYEIKMYLKEPVVVFFTAIMPLMMFLVVNTSIKAQINAKYIIGTNQQYANIIKDAIVVEDYQQALNNKEIDIYVADKIVTKKNSLFAQILAENINNNIQQVTPITKTISYKDESLFIPFLSMQAIYSIFIATGLFHVASKSSETGKRIVISGSLIKMLVTKAFATILITSMSTSLLLAFMVKENRIQITPIVIFATLLIILTGVAIGGIISQIPKIQLTTKMAISVWTGQILLVLGGGFGISMIQSAIHSIPLLKYLSPLLLANRLMTYRFEITNFVVLCFYPIILFIIAYFLGGKNDNI